MTGSRSSSSSDQPEPIDFSSDSVIASASESPGGENQQFAESVLQPSESSQHTIQRITDTVPQILFLFDLVEGRVIYLNRKISEILGYTPEEVCHPNWLVEHLHPDDSGLLEGVENRFTNLADDQVLTSEYRLRHRNGEWRWVCNREVVFSRDASGRPRQILGSVQDISDRIRLEAERKQVELALQESQHRYQLAVQAGRMGVWDWDITSNQIYVDPNLKALLGYDATEIADTFEALQQLVHPDDLEQILAAINAHLEGLTAEYYVEHRMLHRDGSIRWFLTRGVAMRDGQGIPYRMTGTRVDITDRKLAETSIHQTAELQQQAIHRERLIAAISQNIRQSLDLDYILSTTVEEVQQFLQVDRVLIYRFNPDWTGRIVAEALDDEEFSLLNQVFYDPCFSQSMVQHYRRGRLHVVDDIGSASLDPCYVDLLTRLQAQAVMVLPILVRQELWGLLIAHQCTSPCHWQQTSSLLLQQLSTQLAIGIHQAELYQQTQYQARRERMVNRVTRTIRNSLDLATVFGAATSEIGALLHLDRAEILQYLPAQTGWQNVATYHHPDRLPEVLELTISDLNSELADRLKQLQIVRINAIDQRQEPFNQTFTAIYPGAWLLVPLQTGDALWGCLCLNHLHPDYYWQDWEVDLARTIADQLAIAIQQSQLYSEVQHLNADLETQVQLRTAQLQQALEFDALLQRITDKVRDSLDEGQILQTVVTELAHRLNIRGCDVALYDHDKQLSTIRHECLRDPELPAAEGRVIAINDIHEFYSQLSAGVTSQFCRITPDLTRPIEWHFAVLSCPIIDDQYVLGDLWLFRRNSENFSETEIRLVQQVANQCAIAIRQARLYQAAQAQVDELERLNRLKDDFLSTVSHELRSPMSTIKMAAQMLEINLQRLGILGNAQPVVTRYFKILQDECQRETTLINDLLNLSRLDAEIEPLVLTSIDLTAWLPHLIEPFYERIQQHQQQLRLELPVTLPPLITDLSYLSRILGELLTNACKYTPAGETITLSAAVLTQPETILQLCVTNTGVEIPGRELTQIFDKFYRIPNNDPWRYGGTGLGLALVKKLAERLHASVHAESGNGQTSLILRFPLRS